METLVDLFCGGGGTSTGFHQAGFSTAYAVDKEWHCVETFNVNHGSIAKQQDVALLRSETIQRSITSNPVLIPSFLGGRSFGIFDLLPPTSAIRGLRLILLEGWSFGEVWVEFITLVFLSLLYLGVALLLYKRKHLSPQ